MKQSPMHPTDARLRQRNATASQMNAVALTGVVFSLALVGIALYASHHHQPVQTQHHQPNAQKP